MRGQLRTLLTGLALAGSSLFIVPIEQALAQDPRLDRYHLLDPNKRLDHRIDLESNRYHLLGPHQVFGAPNETARYYLLDQNHLRYLEEHRHMFDGYVQDMLERVKLRKYLDAYSKEDTKILEIFAKGVNRGPVGVGMSVLEFLNMSVDKFNQLSEQERQRQYCLYRIALYRKDEIMYPKECTLVGRSLRN